LPFNNLVNDISCSIVLDAWETHSLGYQNRPELVNNACLLAWLEDCFADINLKTNRQSEWTDGVRKKKYICIYIRI